MNRTITWAGCLLGLSTCVPVHAEDWPRFLGPRQDNTSSETEILLDWPDEGPPVLWRHGVGIGYSAPSIEDGKLILFHRVGNEEVITCLEADTAKVLWSHGYPTTYRDRYGYNNGPRSAPLIEQGRVFTYGADGVLTCLALKDGALSWQRAINKERKVPQAFFGAGTPAIPYKNSILVNVGDVKGAGIMAFDQATGKTLWQANNDEASYATGVIHPIEEQETALFLTREGLVGLHPDTGKELFQHPFRSRTHESVNAASPLIRNNQIFLSATYNVGAGLFEVADGAIKEIWRDEDAMQNHWSTSIRVGDFLYGVTGRHESGSHFRCIRWDTGEVMWTAPRGLGRASFIKVKDHFITIGERGELALIEISSERYIEKAKVSLLKYPCWAPPVLSNGLLYLRNEDTLLCLDLRK